MRACEHGGPLTAWGVAGVGPLAPQPHPSSQGDGCAAPAVQTSAMPGDPGSDCAACSCAGTRGTCRLTARKGKRCVGVGGRGHSAGASARGRGASLGRAAWS